jgi:hypothetical protein
VLGKAGPELSQIDVIELNDSRHRQGLVGKVGVHSSQCAHHGVIPGEVRGDWKLTYADLSDRGKSSQKNKNRKPV